MDKLEEIFKLQAKLNSYSGHPLENLQDDKKIEWILNLTRALQQETAEGLTLESLLGTESPEEHLLEGIALRSAIDQLPNKEKMTILLRYFKGLTQAQTARILGISQVQVSRLERRSLDQLRRQIAP